MTFQKEYLAEFPEFDRKFQIYCYLRAKYIVLIDGFDKSIGLNVNPWRKNESTQYAKKVSEQIKDDCLRLQVSYEGFQNFGRKEYPFTLDRALDYYEGHKKYYEVDKMDIASVDNSKQLGMLNLAKVSLGAGH